MNDRNISQRAVELILSADLENLSYLSVTQIARELGVNTCFLSRKFKKDTQILLSDYIRNERIRRAELLLKSRYDLKIEDIAKKVGFETLHYFRRLFREKNGVNPSQYKKITKSKNFGS